MKNSTSHIETFKDIPVRMTIQANQEPLVISHWHPYYECNRVLEGQVEYTVNNTVIIAEKNDVIFIPSYSIHAAKALTPSASIMGLVYQNISYGDPLLAEDQIYLESSFEFQHHFLVKHDSDYNHDLCRKLSEIYQEYISDYPFRANMLISYLNQITTIFARCIGVSSTLNSFGRHKDDILKTINYIHQNYPNKITLETLCSLVNLSPFHFSRLFKNCMGISPIEYILHYRIKKALHFITSSNLSVTEISEAIGFCNVNYFITKFKEITGYTPLAYKKLV